MYPDGQMDGQMDLTVSAVRTTLSQGPWGQLGVLCLLVSQLKSYTGWSSNRFMGAVSIILLDILPFLSLCLCEYGHMCTLAYIWRSMDHFECWTPPSILFKTGFLHCLLLHT